MTLHPRPASPDWPNNVETDHPHGGHITLFSCQETSDYGVNAHVRNRIPGGTALVRRASTLKTPHKESVCRNPREQLGSP